MLRTQLNLADERYSEINWVVNFAFRNRSNKSLWIRSELLYLESSLTLMLLELLAFFQSFFFKQNYRKHVWHLLPSFDSKLLSLEFDETLKHRKEKWLIHLTFLFLRLLHSASSFSITNVLIYLSFSSTLAKFEHWLRIRGIASKKNLFKVLDVFITKIEHARKASSDEFLVDIIS